MAVGGGLERERETRGAGADHQKVGFHRVDTF